MNTKERNNARIEEAREDPSSVATMPGVATDETSTGPPTKWPNRAKLIVAVLLIAAVLGGLGTIVGFTSSENLSAEVEQLESEVVALTNQRDEGRALVDTLEGNLAQFDTDLANETRRADAAEADVAASERQVADLESTVATLTSDLREARDIIDQLEADLIHDVVSAGQGIAVATVYPSSETIHPIALLGDGANGELAGQLPPSWAATSIFETELVIDVGDSVQSVIEECPYNGPNITRYRYSTSVAVYSAATAERIADATLTGADPRACRHEEPWNLTELHGEKVTADEIRGWLETHVVSDG